MRKVFLDDLPRWEKGEGSGVPGTINWGKCVNMKVKFIYNTIEGEIEILDYNKRERMLKLKYNENIGYINTGGFSVCKIGNLLIRYGSHKTNNFEIYNILKINEKGIMWDSIANGEVLKTNHKKYGYNEFEFIEYNREIKKICLKYKGDILYISTNSFCKGQIGSLINKHTVDFKVSIGSELIDNKRDLVITDREYRKEKHGKSMVNGKWYKYTCNVCGWTEGWIVESDLIKGRGCSCCVGKTVVNGINDIATTAPWMINIGVSLEDALNHTNTSGKKIKVKCPDCGSYKNIKISDISRNKSIGCRVCGDSTSYPEKFINSILPQKNIIFETQKVIFKDKGNKIRYDFYFEYNDRKYIIEVHGMQHYENVGWGKMGGRSLEEEQENDKYKKKMAKQNGIDEYIVIDCRYSDLEWIKKSVLSSELNKLFNLEDINWLKCEEFALSNLVKKVCEYWNNKESWETTGNLAKVFNLSYNTIARYLKKGNLLGWTKYDASSEIAKVSKENGKKLKERLSVPVYIFKDGNLLGEFPSSAELERQSEEIFGIKLNRNYIANVAKGIQKTHKGFTFKYVENN